LEGVPYVATRAQAQACNRLKVTPAQEIAARPAEINERKRARGWEVDLMIGAGQQGVLLVAVERQSRMVG
jgi:IS30 family transposase